MKLFLSIVFVFVKSFSFAQDDNKPNVYSLGQQTRVECVGGWESDCTVDELFFQTVEKGIYNFSNSIGFNYISGIKFISRNSYDDPAKVVVRQRYIMAFASRVSETEGVVFCDTILNDLKGKKDNSWYTVSKYYPLITDTAGYFILNEQTPPSSSYKLPKIGVVQAKQYIAKDNKWLFETGSDQELRNNREVKLIPYAIELEYTTTYKGKSTVLKLRFRIRHGEC